MKVITCWPNISDLAVLPEIVVEEIYRQLIEPFDDETLARAFWEEAPSTLIILAPHDSIQQLKRDDAWQNIEFALTYPEYIISLKMDYHLVLAIANDSGAGVYLIVPPQLSHILPE